MKYVSSRLSPVKPSPSASVSAAARALRAKGEDVIDLGLGEPDFDTPNHIIDAAYEAAKRGETRYTPMEGTAALREAVIGKLKRDNSLDYALSEVIISNGAKQIIFDAMMASLEEGDEVLLCAPYFATYADIVLILGAKPVAVECPGDNGFRLTPQALEKAITPKTRWLFLNLPSNPSGAVFSLKDLQAIGAIIEKHPQIMVLSDEIYEHILFDGQKFISFAEACPNLKDRTLTVNGVSKAYAMTGWRIGYAAGPEELIKAMSKVQAQVSSGPCSVAQAAAVAALEGPQDEVHRFCEAFEKRRDLVVSRVKDIEGLSLDPPGGAFYALIECSGWIGSKTSSGEVLANDVAFAKYLLEEAKVAVVPGEAYGLSPYFRISTATSEDVLSAAMDRIAEAVGKLTKG